MSKKMCKHNNMSQVLPGLWIGGTKKHTELEVAHDLPYWKLSHVAVVETRPSEFVDFTRFFVCPNYGVPSGLSKPITVYWETRYWLSEITRYRNDTKTGLLTIVTDLGGHGRSGLYCAIIMAHVLGITGSEAIAKLRQMHCEQAVETAEQEAYVVRIADELRDWSG